MKKRLLEIFNSHDYQPKNFEELFAFMGLEDSERDDLEKALSELLDEYEVLLSRKKRYILPRTVNIYKGQISIKNPDFGFITSPDFERDFYVSKFGFNGAMDRDHVVFQALGEYNDSDSFKQEAKVIDILKRNLTTLVGELYRKKGRFYLKTRSTDRLVRVVGICDQYIEGDVVKVEIIDYDRDPVESKVIEKIGFKNDIGIDVLEIASAFNFPLKFPEEVLMETKSLDQDIAEEAAKRKKPSLERIITIDGEDAKDLDDAVGIKKLQNGNYFLGVYIADVSHYVRENSALDREAYSRGTSVYLVNRVIPMLPPLLSNNLCSLNPGVEKLVIACEMEINPAGEVVNSEIFPSALATTHRMTYTNVYKILAGDLDLIAMYRDIYEDLLLMRELKEVLNAMRNERGALDFDVPEGKIIVNDEGKPIRVEAIERGEGERIIEEFMLIANETVATRIYHLDLPFIYRVHEEPNQMKLDNFKLLAKNLGYQMGRKMNSRQLQDFLQNIKEEDAFLKTILLRSMAKAVYSERNVGHYGLSSSCYTHFTAPIRRYPDLLVHRLIRKYLFNYEMDAAEFPFLQDKIADIAGQSSKRERDAIECEYRVEDMKKAEYMEDFIGEKFEGVISGVTKFGLFVLLPNTVEGLVHIRRLPGRHVFDPVSQSLIGIGGETYRLGDKVAVQVIKADKKTSEIDFDLVYNNNGGIKKKKKAPKKNERVKGHGKNKRCRKK